jgi:hypothetical protein
MNKFLTFAGKQPVYLGDINFMQTAVGAAFANLLKHITGRSDANGILSGVVISYVNNSATWTAGVVSLGGEILPVEQGVIGNVTGGLYFEIVSETDGSRVFGDGVSHDCWEIRKATLTTTETDYPLTSVPRIEAGPQESAQVYAFDDIPNLSDRYAKLAYCGGAFVLMIRQAAQSEIPENYFEGDISGLPEALLNKFSASSAPTGVLASLMAEATGSAIYTLPVSWIVSGSKLHVTIGNPSGLFFSVPTELSHILPVF